ncbi:MAG: ABC transporter substrate-binding protein, partial [Rhodocyclaceae bacterium]|nr:ABC transporter substrate-binding protein [Rhodocyclaceae bacterium]
MKNRLLAYAIIALLGIAAAITLSLLNHEPPRTLQGEAVFNIIGRVNNEGSGLFIKNGILDTSGALPVRADNGAPFFGEGYTLSVKNSKAWGGLVFGDPGASSIQHTQMATIAAKVGLKFAQYQDGMTKSGDTLYYVTNLSNAGAIATSAALIDGGIIWEPQYQKVLHEQAHAFRQLARTNDLFADHTCCVVAANHHWLQTNAQDAVKFLAGFAQAVRFINEAKAHPDGEDYAWLLVFAQT